MIPTFALAPRPLIGAAVGLLLVSACGTADESTPTPTSPPPEAAANSAPDTSSVAPAPPGTDETVPAPAPTQTTSLPSTTIPAAVPSTDPAPINVAAVVDVAGRTIFGVSVFEAVDADAISRDVSARLGSPTSDSGWQPTVGESCAGSTDARVLWWGDFRMTFERYQGDGVVRDELSAWTVGDPTLFGLAPIGVVPESTPSNIVTLEGIGLGSTLDDVEAAWSNVNDGGDRHLVVVDGGGTLTMRLDDGDRIIGFGVGPFDCPVDEMR